MILFPSYGEQKVRFKIPRTLERACPFEWVYWVRFARTFMIEDLILLFHAWDRKEFEGFRMPLLCSRRVVARDMILLFAPVYERIHYAGVECSGFRFVFVAQKYIIWLLILDSYDNMQWQNSLVILYIIWKHIHSICPMYDLSSRLSTYEDSLCAYWGLSSHAFNMPQWASTYTPSGISLMLVIMNSLRPFIFRRRALLAGYTVTSSAFAFPVNALRLLTQFTESVWGPQWLETLQPMPWV